MVKVATLEHGEVGFDPARADRAQAFIERLCVHTKGYHARRPFELSTWQRDDIHRPLYGTVVGHSLHGPVRQYRMLWLELARKNGKSEYFAANALLLTGGDDEEEADVYGVAADREQASLVFNVAARMVELSPALSKRFRVIHSRKRIVYAKTGSTYSVIAADAAGNLGQNPHGVIFDEIVSQPNRELFDALTSAEGARTQPLIMCATTAGPDSNSFAANEHLEMLKVAHDPTRDPRTLVVARNTPEDADPFDESVWYYANPALFDATKGEVGFKDIEAMRTAALKAKNDPTKLTAFRVFQLNQWGHEASEWIDGPLWDSVAGIVDETELIGESCVGGLDLAATSDLAALALVFPPTEDRERLEVVMRFWVPSAAAEWLSEITGGLFDEWAAGGFVTVTDGDVLDYSRVHSDIEDVAEVFDVRGIAVDRWNAVATVSHLEQEGIEAHTVGASYGDFSPGMKELMRLTQAEAMWHGGDPVLRWCVLGTQAEMDFAERIRPRKIKDRARSRVRIDGTVALIYALGEMLRRLGLEEKIGAFHSIELEGA